MELALLDWIQAHLRSGPLDVLMSALSRLADHGDIWILLAALLLFSAKRRRQGITVSCALVLDLLACNMVLKPLIGRGRPFLLRPDLILLVSPPGDASFPSGHTAASFAAAFALRAAGAEKRLWIPAMILAAGIAFSRLYLYVHWPSDVLGGILLGAVLGHLSGRLTARQREGKF